MGMGTTGTAVPKEDDPGPAEMRRGVTLSIKETRMGEVTGFKEEEELGQAWPMVLPTLPSLIHPFFLMFLLQQARRDKLKLRT